MDDTVRVCYRLKLKKTLKIIIMAAQDQHLKKNPVAHKSQHADEKSRAEQSKASLEAKQIGSDGGSPLSGGNITIHGESQVEPKLFGTQQQTTDPHSERQSASSTQGTELIGDDIFQHTYESRNEIKELRDEISRLRNENYKLGEKIEDQQTSMSYTVERYETLKDQNELLKEINYQLKENKNFLEDQNLPSDEIIDTLKKEKEKLNEKIKELTLRLKAFTDITEIRILTSDEKNQTYLEVKGSVIKGIDN